MAGLVGGLVVLGLATLVMAVALTMVIALLVIRRKSRSNDDLYENLYGNYAYNTKTEILAIAHMHVNLVNPANTSHGERETSTHMAEYVEITDTDILTSMNATSRLPFPSCVHQEQDMPLTQNQAYVTSGNIPMKANESYGITTTSMDSDPTVEEEHNTTHTSQHPNEEEYDYIIT